MNYIQHLSSFYARISTDDRLSPYHISLYMSLFQLWNASRFENPFPVNRHEVMALAKIGSVNTYLKCLKELDRWEYLNYAPSKTISVGSRIRIISFDNTTGNSTGITTSGNSADTAERHSNKPNKIATNISNVSLIELEAFFQKENFPKAEAVKFFNHYQAKGWMMGSSPMQNWSAAAVAWMAKAEKFNRHEVNRPTPGRTPSNPKPGNLSATTGKKYDEPL